MAELLNILIPLSMLIFNLTTALFCLPIKKSLPVTILIYICFTIAVFFTEYHTEFWFSKNNIPAGLLYLPLIILLFQGSIYKKIFLMFIQLLFTNTVILFLRMTYEFFLPNKSGTIALLMFITIPVIFAILLVFVFKYGKRFFDMLFSGGTRLQWILYILSAVMSFAIIVVIRIIYTQNMIFFYAILLYVISSSAILCYAIINSHEKARQKYEAEFAKGIIASGEDYYKKMNGLLNNLRILRHDFKYHQRVVMEFLQKGETAKAIEYLGGMQNELSQHELDSFCENQVINSLLTWYAGRCKSQNIQYLFKVDIPEKLSIADYDLCIVIGNLLENAVEASVAVGGDNTTSLRSPTAGRPASAATETDRKISMDTMIHNDRLVLKVENKYYGEGASKDAAQKEGGGLGLQSVRLVTERYGGQLCVKSDGNIFTASVLMDLPYFTKD